MTCWAQYYARTPVTISQDTLALNTIQAVVEGEGHFLGQPETYARMRSDFVYLTSLNVRGQQALINLGRPTCSSVPSNGPKIY